MKQLVVSNDFKNEYFKKAEKLIRQRINNNKFKSIQAKAVKSWVKLNLKDILIGDPVVLLRLSKEVQKLRGKDISKAYAKLMSKVFNYDQFSSSDHTHFGAYSLVRHVNGRVCPYCNQNYILFFEDNASCRGPLDHFLPKSIYPEFAVSLFNLIPSCSTCNSLKGGKDTRSFLIHNPYAVNPDDIFKFDIHFSGFGVFGKSDIKISVVKKDGSTESALDKNFKSIFKHEKRYVDHASYGLMLKNKLDYIANDLLPKNFTGNREDLIQLAFNTQSKFYEDDPLGKLERDYLDVVLPILRSLK